jgi:DNA-binding SARP family transcriptional activator
MFLDRPCSVSPEVPVVVRTLGYLDVLVDGVPLRFTGRAPRRPFDLLTAVIASGGRAVSVAALSDLLWPDADGFDAYRCFTTALHRLRSLLAYPDCVRLSAGRVTLEPHRCRVDVWDFERALRGARGADELEAALEQYHGPFLGDDPSPWSLATRTRLEKLVATARASLPRKASVSSPPASFGSIAALTTGDRSRETHRDHIFRL